MDTPFRVTFHLSSPLNVGNHDIHLDALIAWCLVDEAKPKTTDELDALHDQLPLDRHYVGDQWVWKASRLNIEHGPVETRFLTRRFDMPGYGVHVAEGRVKSGHVDESRGQFRNMFEHFQVEHVKKVYCFGVGDVERVAELLSRLEFLGAKTRLGFGRIKEIEIEKINDEDCAWFHRPLPKGSNYVALGYYPRLFRLRPPYWKHEDKGMVMYPP